MYEWVMYIALMNTFLIAKITKKCLIIKNHIYREKPLKCFMSKRLLRNGDVLLCLKN